MTEMGKIPNTGDILIWNKLELEIIDKDGVKIDKVLVKALKE
jgi:putative hemolysin